MLVAPEDATAQQEQQRQDREFGAADALFAAVAVVPGEDQHDRQSRSGERRRDLLDGTGPSKSVSREADALQQPPRAGDVDEAPLHHLAAAKPIPEVVPCPVLWPVGHAALSLLGRSVAGMGDVGRREMGTLLCSSRAMPAQEPRVGAAGLAMR